MIKIEDSFSEERMIKIEDLLPLIKKGYVAMDKNGDWCWFEKKPYHDDNYWIVESLDWDEYIYLDYAFNIAPYDGNWKDSLMECGK